MTVSLGDLVPGQRYVIIYRTQKGNNQWWEMTVTATFLDRMSLGLSGRPKTFWHGRPKFDTFDLVNENIISATPTVNPHSYPRNVRRIPTEAVRSEWR